MSTNVRAYKGEATECRIQSFICTKRNVEMTKLAENTTNIATHSSVPVMNFHNCMPSEHQLIQPRVHRQQWSFSQPLVMLLRYWTTII